MSSHADQVEVNLSAEEMLGHSSSKESSPDQSVDAGLLALCGISAYFRIASDPSDLRRQLALFGRPADVSDLIRAAQLNGLKARLTTKITQKRLAHLPTPCLVRTHQGQFYVYSGQTPAGRYRLVNPVTRQPCDYQLEDLYSLLEPQALLITRKLGGAGITPKMFNLSWFLPSVWRYRKPLIHVLLASFFVQFFALMTPLFFQVVIDKVLSHKGYDTLFVLVGGLAVMGLFDVLLQYLRSYALSHTTNRMDVELGQRLFAHLFRLPMSYFETRAAGQTVARVRELETIRSFLTGQGLFAALDLFFTFVFLFVLFAYSWSLSLIVVLSIPFYLLIAAITRPALRDKICEKFHRGAQSQQLLVESVIGVQTLKAAAIEPIIQKEWEERLAAYVTSSFQAGLLGAGGQGAIQYVNKLTSAALLLFGAKAVIDGGLSVGGLVAFNMIAAQVSQPILRLSQIWQDFQQVQISMDRLGDILNAQPESHSLNIGALPQMRGAITLRNVSFRYHSEGPSILKQIHLTIRPGDVVGIVGYSGSGKSTLTKLIQRFYTPHEGQILIDGIDLQQAPPDWVRRQIGVVLQDNLLFNRSIHENIAIANPLLSRMDVIRVARLSGADEFISKLPHGYDTLIEERGANLSGGQRQRVAIARALATNPRVLIFDEATSALDYESERLIQQNMREIVKGRTVLIIAHRLQALRPCHYIVSLHAGQMVERGSHADLLKAKGLYAHLWSLQNETMMCT